MSKDYLPLQVDPLRFADNATNLRGNLLVKNMERLCPSLLTDEGEVSFTLEFGIDKQKNRYVKGHVEADLTSQCHRCMEPFKYGVVSDFTYGIVTTEKGLDQLPSHYDPLLIKDDVLVIQDMIEEELILNLPIVFMHNPEDCKVRLPIVVAEDSHAGVVEKESPFKVIASLKVKPKQE